MTNPEPSLTEAANPIWPATPRKPTADFMLSHPAHLLALGFGSGLSRWVPGTVGTLFGWLLFHAMSVRYP